MKRAALLITFFLSALGAFASHIVGGEMYYEYLGPGAAPNTHKYRITLRLFRDELCAAPCADMPPNVWIGVFDNGTGRQYPGPNQYTEVIKGNENPISIGNPLPCVVNPPALSYNAADYSYTIDLPINAKGYTAAYQTCCRVNPMNNVFNTGRVGDGTGSTYMAQIPGTEALGNSTPNSSPKFETLASRICAGKPFSLDFSVKEEDGDEISYVFCEAYGGGLSTNSSNINPSAPPYQSVPYISGYSAGQPMGEKVTIDSKTGIISGIAPPVGRYVISVCAYETRGGKVINIHRKDFLVNVADCDFAGAQLDPSYSFCESLTASFQNQNPSNLNKTYFWDFGDGNSSTVQSPVHTYGDTGTYKIKLVVNRNEPCGDSTTAEVKVYPDFKADFSFAGGCFDKPTQFTDRTTTTYGQVASWNWSFGGTGPGQTSTAQNPTHVFPAMGQQQVRLIATSSKGCRDTIQKAIPITDKPFIDLRFRDTLICNGDRLQLEAFGQGNFTWTPGTSIEQANTATPTVFPASTTNYVVRLDQEGCINQDTVQVRVVNSVSLSMPADTVICATDAIQLIPVSNGLRFAWSPASSVSNPDILTPSTAPAATTTYQLSATIGGCTTTESMKVAVVPYPVAAAGDDQLICFENTAQLQASMDGTRFEWTPAALLENPTAIAPTTKPLLASQQFILAVYDNKGCPKPGRDTVLVQVLPSINASAGRDTSVIVGQPLQLQATGGSTYQWLPPLGLNNPNIANPIAVFDGSQETVTYQVLVANEASCVDSASITVRIFQTDPRVFVPTAFTPNGDGKNDLFRPIAVGMSQIQFFRVFNRWGEKVFETTKSEDGWDGRIGGQLQASGTFVWVVKGIDFNGKEFFAKGTVTLIR
ncbi:PKD domain-containing protein [Pseudocnuella soli]|uniref:PKD domain-containing protein n=1 Tax=Pseudocnuella soli TaxID=2502779 RepID=UPI00104D375C|nr:PKD domain-containing protein [Pseudocnuella soli]